MSTTTVCVASPEDVETAPERAARRVIELARAVGGVLEVLGAIYRDEDWRYLSDNAGEPYRDFSGFVRDQLGGSESNARRYRQGVETLVVPLLEIAGPGTRIPVTPNDVALLGVAGAGQVLEVVADQLAGVEAGEAQTVVIRGVIDSVISERRARSALPEGSLTPPALPPSPGAWTAPDSGADEPADESGRASEGSWGGQAPWSDGGASGADFDDDGDGAEPATKRPSSGSGERVDNDSATQAPESFGPGVSRPIGEGCAGDLQSALDVVLRLDPAVLAESLAETADAARTAHECALAAQRLGRLSALLKL